LINKNKIIELTKSRTLLGAGPMSKNCVDVVIDLSNNYKIPIQLIASRRQIECYELGGGYVNSWTTESFSKYVKEKDKHDLVFLSRDHGGPWQNYSEVDSDLNYKEALESCKKSFEQDIANDFQFIHIDPSIDIKQNLSKKIILERVFELYEYCMNTANELGKTIFIEIGTEEQIEGFNEPSEVEENLNNVIKFCDQNRYALPTFYVVQNGSKVKETENTGHFQNLDFKNFIDDVNLQKIKTTNDICLKLGILPKAHNSDYLSSKSASFYPRLNMKGGNIAPEFGVIETKTIVDTLIKNNLKKELNKLVDLSLKSGKWKKWMKKDSDSNDLKKAIICGHYIFSDIEFKALEDEILFKLKGKKINLHDEIKYNLINAMSGYLKSYGWKLS
jgi:hypothetical protein